MTPEEKEYDNIVSDFLFGEKISVNPTIIRAVGFREAIWFTCLFCNKEKDTDNFTITEKYFCDRIGFKPNEFKKLLKKYKMNGTLKHISGSSYSISCSKMVEIAYGYKISEE